MQIIRTKTNSADIKFSLEELIIINNSLNEICYGTDMDESEISVRMGAELFEISSLLKEISHIIEKLETDKGKADEREALAGAFSQELARSATA
jgi:hypothetical protein